MKSRSHALIQKRVRQKWALRQVPSARLLDPEVESAVVDELRTLRKAAATSLNFQHQSASMDSLRTAVLDGLAHAQAQVILAIIGDSDDPAVLHMAAEYLSPLFEKACEQRETLVLATEAADGILIMDFPDDSGRLGEILVSAIGSLTSVVHDVARRIPGGTVFRGK